ncbi:MAG: hypothetical protein ABL925_00015 [Methylococcales bacterium]
MAAIIFTASSVNFLVSAAVGAANVSCAFVTSAAGDLGAAVFALVELPVGVDFAVAVFFGVSELLAIAVLGFSVAVVLTFVVIVFVASESSVVFERFFTFLSLSIVEWSLVNVTKKITITVNQFHLEMQNVRIK